MHLTSANPTGIICHLDLAQIPIWRLELAAVGAQIGVGIRYVASGTTSVALIAGLETGAPDENTSVVQAGLPRWEQSANLARLQESMKILFNSERLKAQAVDELIAKSAGLVRIYHEVRDALFIGADAQGFFEGWRWVVHREVTIASWPGPDKGGEG